MRTLSIAPSEFWGMAPRHFWYLVETLNPRSAGGTNLSEADCNELLSLLNAAERGDI